MCSAGWVENPTFLKPEPMTLTELKYIVAVAREKHFGRAAEACFVSQPTLSVGIKNLEEELQVKLFERNANEVTVTPLGEEIVRQAQSVLDQTASIKETATSDGGEIAIGSGAILTVNGANKGTLFQNSISGLGGLTMNGSGSTTLSLYGTQSYSGATRVSGGKISSGVALATSGVTIDGGTFETSAADILGNSASVSLSSGTYSLGGNDTIGSLIMSGGTLSGSATLSAGSYALNGGTVGANLGSGLLALLTTIKADAVTRRVPLGNFVFKAAAPPSTAPRPRTAWASIPEPSPSVATTVWPPVHRLALELEPPLASAPTANNSPALREVAP
mgnify:CR=1 FL=1